MINVISDFKVPVKLWVSEPEKETLRQAENLANLPFVFKHVALMPDAHTGYGMPIGGVLATKNVVIPNCVGVDIGCGMCAVKTSLTEIDTIKLKEILSKVRETVPVGFDHHKRPQLTELMPTVDHTDIVEQQYLSALKQLGTLGGGKMIASRTSVK